MTHVRSRLGGLELREFSVGLRNLEVGGEVRVCTRQGVSLEAIWRQRLLQQFSLLSLEAVLLSSCLVSHELLELDFTGVGRSNAVLHSLDGFFENTFLFFLFLLHFEGLGLKHGQLRDCGQHFAGELSCPSLVFVDFLSDF